MTLAKPIAERLLATSLTACQGADAIVFSTIGFTGYHVAEKLGVPSISAPLQPLTPTRRFPGVGTTPHSRLGGVYNWLSHVVYQQVFWQLLRPYLNPWRRDVLKLKPMPWNGPYTRIARERLPFVYGYSPLVVPKPPDWGEWIHVCGYWFLDAAETYQPPDDLIAFLQSGPPPVYVGFGSMIHRDPARVAEMAVKALAIAQQRGILLTGWAGLNHRNLPDHVFQVDAAPHDWLFPRTAAVVHHGGAGTAAAGLRAGVPSIVVPFFADQHFWGERAHALGVGPKPIPQKQLTAERLAEAIHIAVTDQAMRARAADLGRRLQAEDGVGRAVEVIQDYLTDIRGSKSSTL